MRMRRLLALSVLACPVLLAPAATGTATATPAVGSTSQLIVTWTPGSSSAARASALADVAGSGRRHLSAALAQVDLVDLGGDVGSAVATLARNPAVTAVEPNRVLRRAGAPRLSSLFNDPLLADGTQWHLLGDDTSPGNGYGINAVRAFRAGELGDPSVYVGVIDEGVDVSHPDLAANVFTNPWDAVNGRDDDHNGYIDDVHGWDFVHDDASVFDGKAPSDFIDAHGTVVAGEIAAVQGNGLGVSGAAPGVKVIPTKFLGVSEGTTAGAIAALDYLTDLKLRHRVNVVATSNSYEGDNTDSAALEAAIQRGADADLVFVTIAGNGDSRGRGYDIDTTPNYPASLHCTLPTGQDCMIVATAISKNGSMASFANWGAHTVDIGAPGVSVESTFPFSGYLSYSGTSQAGPLVAAAVALYRSKYPAASASAARTALLSTAVPTKSLTGRTVTGGRLDVFAALAHP